MGPLIRPNKGMWPRIAAPSFIAETAAVIGDVEIGPQSSIWYGVVLRGDGNAIRVGRRTNIQDGTIVHITTRRLPTIIGDDVTIGHGCIIHACTLKDRSFVGMGATVLDGAVVETEGWVAAGAVVPPGKVVKSGEVWSGVPAKYWRPIKPTEIESIDRIAEHYWEVAEGFLEPYAPREAADD